MRSQSLYNNPFFHPDCTVGSGVSPDLREGQKHMLQALVGCTTGRELSRKAYDPHPAPKE